MRDFDAAVHDFESRLPLKKGQRGTSIDLKVTTVRENNSLGGHSAKNMVEGHPVRVGGEKQREIELKMLVKKAPILNRDTLIGEEKMDEPDAVRYYQRWQFLRKIGMPTVSSMRVVDEKRIAMGDMTADGSSFFGKAEIRQLRNEYYGGVKRQLTETEKIFMGIDEEKIRGQIEELQNLAWSRRLALPFDEEEYTILVHPDGSWQVLVMDLSFLGRIDTPLGKTDYLSFERHRLFTRLDVLRNYLTTIDKDK